MISYFFLGFAPGIYWLYHFYQKDRLEPEPRKLLFKLYLFGILSAFIVMLIQLPFNFHYLTAAVLIAPIVEESAKLLLTYLGSYRNKNFNEPADGMIYAIAVALGFASIENAFYLLRISGYSQDLASGTILIRSLLSVPAHALFSSFWGYALGLIKMKQPAVKTWVLIAGLLTAIISHSFFNLFCFIQHYSSIALLILIAFLWEMFRRNFRKAEKASPFYPRSE